MKQLKYCKDCKWSNIRNDPYTKLKCTNPRVNILDSYELSRLDIVGRDCLEERSNRAWFGVACGLKGKLFDPKPQKLDNTDHIVDL